MPDGTTTETAMRFATSAHVDIRAAGASTSELETIKGLMQDPSVLDERGPDGELKHRLFIWTAEISNDNIDTYYTRMHDSTLGNFRDDAEKGVMFLDSHISRKLGFGQSFAGTFKKRRGENPSRVLVDFYTISGINLNGVSTDDFIAGVRSSVLRDVSVGFLPGRFECNICGGDPMDWWFGECPHVPGVTYNADGSPLDGDKSLSWWDLTSADAQLQRALRDYSLRATMDAPITRAKKKSDEPILCYAWVIDARLGEVSAVFDGATPGAGILKAQYLASEGKADERSIRMLEMQLRTNLPRPSKIYVVRSGGDATATVTATIPQGAQSDEISRTIRAALGIADQQGDDPVDDTRTNDEHQPVEQPVEDPVVESDDAVDETDDEEDAASDDESSPAATDDTDAEDAPAETDGQTSGGDDSAQPAASEDSRMSGNGTPDFATALRALLAEHNVDVAADADPVVVARATLAELPSLRERAALGDKYKSTLIDEALSAARTAFGKDFSEERQAKIRRLLERADIDEIVEQRDLYRQSSPFQSGRAARETVTDADMPENNRAATDDDDLDESVANLSRFVPVARAK